MEQRHIELLSPAGDAESLRAAVDFGADAVYMGGLGFGLRSPAESKVTADELAESAEQYGNFKICVPLDTLNIKMHQTIIFIFINAAKIVVGMQNRIIKLIGYYRILPFVEV